MTKWYEKSGDQGDVILSTRIRLARNIKEYPFPGRLSLDQRQKVEKAVCGSVGQCMQLIGSPYRFINMEDISKTDAVSLVERHLVSPEFISDTRGRGLILSDDESVSIMINEEDHLRIQVMREGLALDQAYSVADKLDTLLNERLDFAFDECLGYLTQCPTNLGTGMRASLMLHLPALQESGVMGRVANSLSKLGLAIRGIYGEGSEPVGAIYQLSNQVTLGLSEKEAIENLGRIAMQLVSQERAARKTLSKNIETQDSICRSLGILQNARMLTNDEFMKLLSKIRIGISEGLIPNISYDKLNALMVRVQPATIMLPGGQTLSPAQRDVLRAKTVREVLAPVG